MEELAKTLEEFEKIMEEVEQLCEERIIDKEILFGRDMIKKKDFSTKLHTKSGLTGRARFLALIVEKSAAISGIKFQAPNNKYQTITTFQTPISQTNVDLLKVVLGLSPD